MAMKNGGEEHQFSSIRVLDTNIRGRCPTGTLSHVPFSAKAVPRSLPNAFRLSDDVRNCKGEKQ